MTATKTLKIKEILPDKPDFIVGVVENIAQTVNKAITSIDIS